MYSLACQTSGTVGASCPRGVISIKEEQSTAVLEFSNAIEPLDQLEATPENIPPTAVTTHTESIPIAAVKSSQTISSKQSVDNKHHKESKGVHAGCKTQ